MTTLTERQARIRLGAAIKAAGTQKALAERLPLKPKAAETAISRSFLGRQAMHPEVLAVIGLRRDPRTGIIHDDAPRSSLKFIAVEASGEAGVAATAALIGAVLGRDS